ncbi:MAG: LamG-like jellyroll fold domain-containing protein [Planctomycetota bacterium]|jgi:hypothetical protein
MSKKLIYLFSFVLVMAVVSDASADLVGYWKLDEGTGTTVADSSGAGHNGVFAEGTPEWVEGKFGKALKFNGSNKVEIPDHPDFHLEDAVSMAVWIKPEAAVQPDFAKLFMKDRTVEYPYVIQYVGNGGSIRAAVYTSGAINSSSTPNFAGQWGHLCMTYDGSALILYKDAEEVARIPTSGKIQQNDLSLSIGGRLGSSQNFIGIIDDVRLYSHALTKAEIQQVMEGPPAGPAYKPSPDNGQTDVPRDVVLSWTPGEFASLINGHKVYFSENFSDVNDDIGGVTQSASSYAPPQHLDFETTYYWRVDEVNNVNPESPWTGNVWSFTTEPVAYPIDSNDITATASSTSQAEMSPENTINGSGLDENDLHSNEETGMWLSSAEPLGAWIQYEFDKIQKLYQMWVWNSNQTVEPLVGFGLNDVTIEYSTNGTDYMTLGTTHEFARAPGMPGYAHNTTIDFGGAAAKYVRLTANSNWGGIMPQYSLSEVRFFYMPIRAREASPDPGATGVDVDVTLGWRAGREAVTHDVYLSTDEQAVIDGTAPVTIVTETSYGPLSLDLGTTYYWRVDEVNEAETPITLEGDLWSFTTTDHLIVDDFESYNDLDPAEPESNRIFNVWIDGYGIAINGSLVGYEVPPFCERTIVHSGGQSMPFFYSNTGGAAYSEAELTLTPAQNWTEANLALTGWQAWNIDLASSGASLQNVTKLAIGIDGNGASGTLYVDSIGLYARSREFITPSEPDNVRLIGHWKFDGDTQDSSGRGNHGTAGITPPVFVAGKIGSNAMEFRGADYVVIDGVVDDITSTDITLNAWIKTTQSSEGNVFAANTATGDHPLMFGVISGSPFVNDGGDTTFPPPVNDDLWHMITYVRDGDTGYIYVDGALRGTYSAGFSLGSVTRWSIGQEWDTGPSDFYNGEVDDARIYDYPLSAGEVAWLAGKTQPFDKPF